MSLKGWSLSLAVVLIVYMAFLAKAFAEGAQSNRAVGLAVLITVLVRPLFWLVALPAFGLVFWMTFNRAPGPH